jgi:hypothetical protein
MWVVNTVAVRAVTAAGYSFGSRGPAGRLRAAPRQVPGQVAASRLRLFLALAA